MNRDYAGLINSTNKAMMEKLKENEHKRSFDDLTFEYALKRTREEQAELRLAVISNINFPSIDALKEIRREAADLCNFSGMIILKCDKLIDAMEINS